MATTQQEKLLGEKEAALEKQVQETQGLTKSLAQKDEEVQCACIMHVFKVCCMGYGSVNIPTSTPHTTVHICRSPSA